MKNGTERIEILDKKEVDKGIIENIEYGVNFLKEQTKVRYEIKKITRDEFPEYPEDAYREAVINAIIHRDYTETGEVAVEKLEDRIIINNPGGIFFPKEKFGTVSRLRNNLLADLLSKTRYMEKVGTGIIRMRSECKRNKNDLIFDFSKVNFFVTFMSNNQPVAALKKVTKKVTKNQERIIVEMRENSTVTIKEMAKRVGISERKIKANIAALKREGFIKHIGSARSGHWEVVKNNL